MPISSLIFSAERSPANLISEAPPIRACVRVDMCVDMHVTHVVRKLSARRSLRVQAPLYRRHEKAVGDGRYRARYCSRYRVHRALTHRLHLRRHACEDKRVESSQRGGHYGHSPFFSIRRSMPTANAEDPCRSEGYLKMRLSRTFPMPAL